MFSEFKKRTIYKILHMVGALVTYVFRFLLLVLVLLVAVVGLRIAYVQYLYRDLQGNESLDCVSSELTPIASGMGMVVTGHDASCDPFGGNWATYIYVHKVDEAESRQSLVFRFDDVSYDYTKKNDFKNNKPKFEWIDPHHVRIGIAALSRITKQVDYMDGVNISYVVGRIDAP